MPAPASYLVMRAATGRHLFFTILKKILLLLWGQSEPLPFFCSRGYLSFVHSLLQKRHYGKYWPLSPAIEDGGGLAASDGHYDTEELEAEGETNSANKTEPYPAKNNHPGRNNGVTNRSTYRAAKKRSLPFFFYNFMGSN